MNNLEIRICRLCFNLIYNEKYDPLEGSLKMMLGIITPNLKFEITNNPIMCKECSNCVQKAFDFKTNFFEVEEIIEAKKEERNLNCPTLSDLIIDKQNRKSLKSINYCRTCLVKIEGQLFIDMKKKSEKQEEILLLKSCLFEMDSNLTTDCKVCLPCFDKLEEMNKFKIKCMKNDEKIITYLEENPLKSGVKLNLHQIVSVSIKKEKNQESEIINVKPEIKKERSSNVSDSSRTVKIERSELDDHINNVETECSEQSNTKKTEHCDVEKFSKTDSSGRKTYVCPVKTCSVTSRYKYSIRRHITKVHNTHKKSPNCKKTGGQKKMFKCTQCDYTSSNNYLETIKHLLSHANTDTYRCTRCPYTNFQKSELIRHIFSHVDDESVQEYRTLHLETK